MERLTAAQIAEMAGGKITRDGEATGVSTDTRSIKNGDLFIALKGERFNGNDFAEEAVKKGASVVMLSEQKAVAAPAVLVQDTGEALKSLAREYLKRFSSLLIAGVTGSNGKTTVKDMAGSVLSKRFKTLVPKGSFNNSIGMPLTILGLDSGHGAMVLEYGTNHAGEIGELCRIARPHAAAVTCIGTAHIEYFGERKNILEEKLTLARSVREGGRAVLNFDDPMLKCSCASLQGCLGYSMTGKADISAEQVASLGSEGYGFILNISGKKVPVKLAALGLHNVSNALAAAGLGHALGMRPEEIAEGLSSYRPVSKHRLARKELNGLVIIDDTYNANPEAVLGALSVLSLEKGRKVAVLGDMGELGEGAAKMHFEAGKSAAFVGLLVAVGGLAKEFLAGAAFAGLSKESMAGFSGNKEAAEFLKKNLSRGDVVLVKGSRKMRMEEIVADLERGA